MRTQCRECAFSVRAAATASTSAPDTNTSTLLHSLVASSPAMASCSCGQSPTLVIIAQRRPRAPPPGPRDPAERLAHSQVSQGMPSAAVAAGTRRLARSAALELRTLLTEVLPGRAGGGRLHGLRNSLCHRPAWPLCWRCAAAAPPPRSHRVHKRTPPSYGQRSEWHCAAASLATSPELLSACDQPTVCQVDFQAHDPRALLLFWAGPEALCCSAVMTAVFPVSSQHVSHLTLRWPPASLHTCFLKVVFQ